MLRDPHFPIRVKSGGRSQITFPAGEGMTSR